MGDNQQATAFPTPPPFYKHFTKQNVKQLQRLQKEQEKAGEDVSAELSDELRYLVPPEPPTSGKWRTFGYEHDLAASDPTLEEAQIRKLYPDHPAVKLAPQAYLITLARSLLTTFLATCGILAQNPSLYEEKTKNLREIVFNMHDLINQYRPHQARESLILMMEEHIGQLRQEIKTIEELKGRTQQALSGLQQSNAAETATSKQETERTEESSARERQLNLWSTLRELDNAATEEQVKPESAEDG